MVEEYSELKLSPPNLVNKEALQKFIHRKRLQKVNTSKIKIVVIVEFVDENLQSGRGKPVAKTLT